MEIREFVPAPELRPYVQLIWSVDFTDVAGFRDPERIAPDGIVELVLHYHGRMEVLFGDVLAPRNPRSFVVCQTSRYIDIHSPDTVGFVSVRFLPWGAVHFIDRPVAELADAVTPAVDIWPAVTDLEERLAGALSATARVQLVEAFLVRQLRRNRTEDVREAIQAVWRRGGNLTVRALAGELGVSDRTANRIFTGAVGLSPKRYARLVRFLTACAHLRRGDARSFGQVAHACGYYDQAHFNSDFKALLGVTPTEFMSTDRLSFLELE